MLTGIIWDVKKTATMGCYTDGNKEKLVLQTLIKMETLANYVSKSKRFLIGQ